MRTTVTVADDVLDAARRIAVDEHRSVGSVIEEAMRALLARRAAAAQEPASVSLRTFDGGGYQPGVDVNDNARLLDVLEERQ